VHLRCFTAAIIAASLLCGCATQPKENKRLHALQLKIKKQRARLQDLRERNLVLEKRIQREKASDTFEESREPAERIVTSEPPAELPGSFIPTTKGAAPVVMAKRLPNKLPAKLAVTPLPIAAPVAAAAVAPTPISIAPEKTGEHYLYSKILETYRSKNAEEMQRTQQLLLKSYPESVFADNALYLSGMLAFENQDYKLAARQFDRLLKQYPRSNKAVAALFARASVEKRMGRPKAARRSLLQVRDLYPGSPEAARVSVQLKLLERAGQTKRRES
jgi:TolA-binding protein